MATITSARLTIAAGPAAGSVVISLHGALDVPAGVSLQMVLDDVLDDPDVLTIRIDLRHVRGTDIGGIPSLAVSADRADERGAELRLSNPPELLWQALESEGVAGLVATGSDERRAAGSASEIVRRQARRSHPSGRLLVLAGPDEDPGGVKENPSSPTEPWGGNAPREVAP